MWNATSVSARIYTQRPVCSPPPARTTRVQRLRPPRREDDAGGVPAAAHGRCLRLIGHLGLLQSLSHEQWEEATLTH